MRHRLTCIALLAAGCGRIGFTSVDRIVDASTEDTSAAIDASFDASNLPGRSWSLVLASAPPGPRKIGNAAYVLGRQSVIFYGGPTVDTLHADQWEFDTTQWTPNCDPCAPGPRLGHGLTFDRARSRLVLYGGETIVDGIAQDDLWEWDGLSWSAVTPAGTPPPGLKFLSMAYDEAREVVVMAFGIDSAGTLRDEV